MSHRCDNLGNKHIDRNEIDTPIIDVASIQYVKSDQAVIQRVPGRDFLGKSKILVMNDKAHHAYRIPSTSLEDYYSRYSLQRCQFDFAAALTESFVEKNPELISHVVFQRLLAIIT